MTDDYELVSKQLDKASSILAGVESQDDIDKMKDSDYQAISDWLEGTQNRKESTSLIGDGVVSCAAMLPGFAYGNASADNAERQRAASIVLATDNVVSGKPTYTLDEALNLTKQAQITVDGLFFRTEAERGRRDHPGIQIRHRSSSWGVSHPIEWSIRLFAGQGNRISAEP